MSRRASAPCGVARMFCPCAEPSISLNVFGARARAYCAWIPGNLRPAAFASSRAVMNSFLPGTFSGATMAAGASRTRPSMPRARIDRREGDRRTAQAAADEGDRGGAQAPKVPNRCEDVPGLADFIREARRFLPGREVRGAARFEHQDVKALRLQSFGGRPPAQSS